MVRVGTDEIWSVSVPVGDISPLSISQAAGLGADVSRRFHHPCWGSSVERDVTPTVWWGVADDVIEVRRRFSHLCEE